MKSIVARRLPAFALMFAFFAGLAPFNLPVAAQSRRQTPPTTQQRRNQRPSETPAASPAPGETPPEPPPPDLTGRPQDAETLTVTSALVNVEAVVYNKRTRQIVTGLQRANFAIFEDNERRDITYFSTPESPITVTMVLEYSKLSDRIGGDRFEPGSYEIIRPAAMFLSRFIQPPNDYVSVVAYDLRTTPLTDFTNDPARLQQVISLLLRNPPAFSEANMFDAIKLVLVGGRADSVVLENSPERTAEYGGMVSVQGRRRAVILIASGIDTFSRINYDEARRVAQNAGVPIYIIGTGNLFFRQHGDQLGATDDLLGNPGRMTFYQAQNALNTFARETGGMYWPVSFPGEIPNVLASLNALLRSQYSLGYNPGERRDGRRHRITVRVDVDGDGQFDDREFEVRARQFYNAPNANATNGNRR